MRTNEPQWVGVLGLAEEIGVPAATVYGWNHKGTGPRFYRVGRHVRYRRADIEAWLEQHAVTPGSVA